MIDELLNASCNIQSFTDRFPWINVHGTDEFTRCFLGTLNEERDDGSVKPKFEVDDTDEYADEARRKLGAETTLFALRQVWLLWRANVAYADLESMRKLDVIHGSEDVEKSISDILAETSGDVHSRVFRKVGLLPHDASQFPAAERQGIKGVYETPLIRLAKSRLLFVNPTLVRQ